MGLEKTGGAILVVGGGRWARVYLSVLADLEHVFSKIIVVSSHGGQALADAIAQADARRPGQFAQAQDLRTVLETQPVAAAILANAARDHARLALELVARKIPLLVEKPVALTEAECASLIAAAKAGGTPLMPGHVLAFCAYLDNFAAAARQALGPAQSITIRWADAAVETRYGESKAFDAGLGVVEDAGAHIATILSKLLGGKAGAAQESVIARGGLAVELRGQWNGIPYQIGLERDGAKRERLILWQNRDGLEARLDFAAEPGTIEIAGRAQSADPQWPRPHGPLTLQLLAFFRHIAAPQDGTYLQTIEDTTQFIAAAARQVRTAQERLIAQSAGDGPARHVAARELLAPRLAAAGIWRGGDNPALDSLTQDAMARLAASPRLPLEDLVRGLAPNP